MSEQKFFKSEQGSKAAWKGFSSQTTYIAHRIMSLNDDSDFYPEQIEDLLIQKDGTPIELVQVKNLTSDLSLSSLSPNKEDSFFHRCLVYREQNPDLLLKIVSFGNIGLELQGVLEKKKSDRNSVTKKLSDCGYSKSDIDWLLDHLVIDKIHEKELLSGIFIKLETAIEAMAAPHVVLDMLCQYVSQLSRSGGQTSKDIWKAKLHDFGLDLAALTGMARQYGNTLIPLYEYSSKGSLETLQKEYLEGVNALPQHIRSNLDVERCFWLNEIANAFSGQNIVIIRGASGQGKSSLAYRYLLNNYSESDVICVEKITSEEQAVDIRSALMGIAKNRTTPIIAYLDVAPYDTNWLWLCEKLYAMGADIRLLVTIREEDYRRTVIDHSKLSCAEIGLAFDKEEATELFQLYSNHDFLSFDDAWKSFGEAGPLMEFTYMLNQSEILKDRLSAQIKRIIQNEDDSDEWLRALSIISYAGKGNICIDVAKLFSVTKCPHWRKMLDLFEKEYFLRTVSNGRFIESLHALRATVIYDILKDEILFPELDVLIAALSSTDENALMMVVAFIYENGISSRVVDALSTVKYSSWTVYASVLKALLWSEVWEYYQKNKTAIDEGNLISNNSFPILFLGDVTGYYAPMDLSAFGDFLEKNRPGVTKEIETVLMKLNPRTIEYSHVDRFIQSTIDTLPVCQEQDGELTPAGYCLFWFAKRNYQISEKKCPFSFDCEIDSNLIEDYLNFLVGVQEQKWDLVYTSLYGPIIKKIKAKYNLVYYDDTGVELFASSIINIVEEGEQQQFSNTHIMSIVDALRRLCTSKDKYNVEIIGYNIIDGITVPDMEKHIPADKLPWVWVTQLNGWLNKLNEYDLYPEHWDVCLQNIVTIRENIVKISKDTIAGIDYLFEKRNTKKLIQDAHMELILDTLRCMNDSHAFSPQSEYDKYGIHSDNAIVQDLSSTFDMQKGGKEQRGFLKHFSKYCSSFSNYLNQRNELILNKVQGNEPSNIGRLSLVNLISALEELPKMQATFRREFALKAVSIDCDNEYHQLLLLSAIWSYLFAYSLHIEKSVAYRQKEYVKKYRRKIDSYLQTDIAQYDGVLSTQVNKQVVEINADAEKVDAICSNIFNDVKGQFSEIAYSTLEGFLWTESIDRIDIRISLLNEIIPGGYSIPSTHFKTYDNLEKFLKFRSQIREEGYNVEMQSTLKTALLKCFAYFQPMQMLAYHTQQVYGCISEKDTEMVDEKVLQSWKDKTLNVIHEGLDDVRNSIGYIFENLDEDTVVQVEAQYVLLLSQIKEYREYLSSRIFSALPSDVAVMSDNLSTHLATFIDILPSELFL